MRFQISRLKSCVIDFWTKRLCILSNENLFYFFLILFYFSLIVHSNVPMLTIKSFTSRVLKEICKGTKFSQKEINIKETKTKQNTKIPYLNHLFNIERKTFFFILFSFL